MTMLTFLYAFTSSNSNKCLSKLRWFIEEHHAGDGYRFWPDLASSYYTNETRQWLLQQTIKIVAKQVNPANIRKARPIEDLVNSC